MRIQLRALAINLVLNEIAELGIKIMGFAKENDFESAAPMEKELIDSFSNVKQFIAENNIS